MNRRDFFKKTGMAVGGAMALNGLTFGGSPVPAAAYNFQTKHVIWIINGNGSRKKEWYESPELCPNYARLVKEGFVYEESHNETVSQHVRAWTEVTTGNLYQTGGPIYPTPLHYVRKAYGDGASNYWLIQGVNSYRQWLHSTTCLRANRPGYGARTRPVSLTATQVYRPDMKRTPAQVVAEEFPGVGLTTAEKQKMEQFIDATYKARPWEFNLKNAPIPRDPFIADAVGLELIPNVLKEFKPRMLIYHQAGHDAGHGNGGYPRQETGYFEYEKVCRTTDEQLGKVIDFVKNDSYFSKNTAIIVRPEFGRDDEVNRYGEINHSDGYNQSCRSAEIWWGPDFKVGVDTSLKNRMDLVPSITKLFNVDATDAIGQVHPEMFKESVGEFPAYQPWTQA